MLERGAGRGGLRKVKVSGITVPAFALAGDTLRGWCSQPAVSCERWQSEARAIDCFAIPRDVAVKAMTLHTCSMHVAMSLPREQ